MAEELIRLPITAPVQEFAELVHIPRTRIYQLLKDGELESVMLGGRRLILCGSYIDMLERLRSRGKDGGRSIPISVNNIETIE